ncbi:MAG: glucan biosynthesis protein D [Acetobacterales bacterium]
MLDRRALLRSTAAGALVAALMPLGRPALAQQRLAFGPSRPFSFDRLVEGARRLSEQPYQARPVPAPEVVEQIDYEALHKIRFDPDNALFADGPGLYPATFFHLGKFFRKPVRMYAVQEGEARELRYSADYFEMPDDSPARRMPDNAGFAGFRLQETRRRDDWQTHDWIAFLGASYFRAIGALEQYGLSARGIALDVATPGGEEFPDFTDFYIEPGGDDGGPAQVYAMLDGPSVAGAYRFTLHRGEGVVTEVENRLFMRRGVTRFGIAPLSSMMWYAEYNRPFLVDWRPEVHDSGGLELWTGAGERIYRPLNNPPRVMASSFLDNNPRGFGFMQRDREFTHYLDGVRYERRPSVWIEPIGDWGPGSVQLVEIPTDDEIHDNVTCFWVPEAETRAGDNFHFHYRLHWQADNPYPAPRLARTVATRIGRGGQAGRPRPDGVTKFVVEFEGEALDALGEDAEPQANIAAGRGEVSYVYVERMPGMKRWRAHFDVQAKGTEPVELRLFVSEGTEPLSETWLFQHFPQLMPW